MHERPGPGLVNINMAPRDEIMKQFGPILLEAFVYLLLDEINTLRDEQGMPEITIDDLFQRITNHLGHLGPYDWMTVPQ